MSEYKQEYDNKLIEDFQQYGDLRPIRKTGSVGPSVSDRGWHTHTSGAKAFKMMSESNAAQQYIKSTQFLLKDPSRLAQPTLDQL